METGLQIIPGSVNPNSPEKVEFRQKIMLLQKGMEKMAEFGMIENNAADYPLKHYFVPPDKKYKCAVYAREISLPKGHVVIGKIHKNAHLTFMLKGKISVETERGKVYLEAPCTFISEPGVKRAAYVEEDTIWTTVHLTEYCGEEKLDEIEDEVVAKTYEEIGLIASVQEPAKLGEPE